MYRIFIIIIIIIIAHWGCVTSPYTMYIYKTHKRDWSFENSSRGEKADYTPGIYMKLKREVFFVPKCNTDGTKMTKNC